jgi:hypothetical protein
MPPDPRGRAATIARAAVRALLPLLAAAAAAACAAPSGRGAPPIPLPPGASGEALAAAAARIESGLDRFHLLPWGALGYGVRLPEGPDGPRIPEYGADTCAWTGALLAAECERRAATGEVAALERVRSLLRGLETLHAVTGEPGLFARYACPAGFVVEAHHPGDWRDGGAGWEGWRWRGDLSKDQVAGLVHGLAAVIDLVDDAACRARAARLLGYLADRLLGRGLVYQDRGGVPTTYGNVSPSVAGLPVGVNAAVALGLADAAARATGEPRHRRAFDALVADGACAAVPYATVRLFGKENFNNPNMVAMALSSILRAPAGAGDPARVRFRAAALRTMDSLLHLHRGEGNAFWLSVALPAGRAAGATARDLADARAQLARFPADLALRRVDLSDRADLPRSAWRSKRGRIQFRHPLPVDDRGPDSFTWKTNPFEVIQEPRPGGGGRCPGADYLAAYWPLRRLGAIPAAGPLAAPPRP